MLCLGVHILPRGKLTDILFFSFLLNFLRCPFSFLIFSDFIHWLPPHYFVSQCFIALSSIFHPLSISPFGHEAFSNHPSDEEWLIYHILSISSLLMALLLAKHAPTYSLALIWTGRILLSLPYFFLDSQCHCTVWFLTYSHSPNLLWLLQITLDFFTFTSFLFSSEY